MFYIVLGMVILFTLILIALIVRFVTPEMIYSVRHALVKIRTNKVFLDYDANRFTSAHVFPDLLMKDFRYETRDYDEAHVLQRVMKVRELYRVLDLRRPAPAGRPSKGRKPQVCIIELAGLLGNLGRHVTPDQKFTYATVDASTILASIANKIREKIKEPPLENAGEVALWFTDNPMSIEQVVELMIAAVFGLAYRQRVQRQISEEVKQKESRAPETGGDARAHVEEGVKQKKPQSRKPAAP